MRMIILLGKDISLLVTGEEGKGRNLWYFISREKRKSYEIMFSWQIVHNHKEG